MDQNYLKKYLEIKIFNDKTVVEYCNEDNICYIHEYQLGLEEISKNAVSEIIMSNWVSGIIYALENISLTDRVPTFIYLTTEKYGSVFEKILTDKETYSQFYLEPNDWGQGVRVIIKKINYRNVNSHLEDYVNREDLQGKTIIIKNNKENSKSYERYTKTISQFKV